MDRPMMQQCWVKTDDMIQRPSKVPDARRMGAPACAGIRERPRSGRQVTVPGLDAMLSCEL